jgi:hypothetical protein
MSLQLFKDNLTGFLNLASENRGIEDAEELAAFISLQYDLLIKSGFQTVNQVPIVRGNSLLLTATIYAVLNITKESTKLPSDIVGDIAKCLPNYWIGASLPSLATPPIIQPTPIVPAPPLATNIQTISSFVSNTGVVPESPPLPPSDSPKSLVENLSAVILTHLATLEFDYIIQGITPLGIVGIGTLKGIGFTVPG